MRGIPGDLERAYRMTRAVAGALWLSLGVYLLMAHTIAGTHAPFSGFAPPERRTLLRLACIVLAVLTLGVGRALRARILAGAPTLYVAPHREASAVAQRLFTVTLVTLALWETVAVLGFAGFLFTGSLLDLYVFLGVAAAGFVLHFPRYSRWEAFAAGRRPTV